MKRHFENLVRQSARIVRHWWMLLLAGILCVAAGVMVFVFPLESYMTLALIFGLLIVYTGASQLFIAGTSGNHLMMKSYVIVGGVLDLIIGLFLCLNPGVTLVLLPILIGLWLMYHSFILISLGDEMKTFKINGGRTLVIGGILLLVISVFVLVKPFDIGVDAVITILGVGFILLGLLLCAVSLTLRDIHRLAE